MGRFTEFSGTGTLQRVFDTNRPDLSSIRIFPTRRPLGCFWPSDRMAGWDSHLLEIADFHGILVFQDSQILFRFGDFLRLS